VVSGDDSNAAVAAPFPLAVPGTAAPGTTAAVMANFALILKKRNANFALLLKKHVSALIGRIDTLHSEAASNHGHITKRLFLALEAKFASLENLLATTTQALEAKGESLLAKCTALEDTIRSRPLSNGDSSLWSQPWVHRTPPRCARWGHVSPPMTPPHGRTPGTSATPERVSQDGVATCPCVERNNVDKEVDNSPADAPLDVNARTRLAYDNARALNLPYYAGPHHTPSRAPAATRHNTSPVRNTYPRRQPLQQTTLPETFGHKRRPGVPTPVDTSSGKPGAERGSGGNRPIAGGSLISPRHHDWDLCARTLGVSRFDVIKLACSKYHIGRDGVTILTNDILEARCFAQVTATLEDVMMCYNHIILAHRKIIELWYNAYAHTSGPQVDKIIQKLLSVFPCLESTKVEDVLDFYDHLQEAGLRYVITLLPFDAIVLAHGFEGLCPPGLGLVRYATMSKALMELVTELILSGLFPQVNATLASVRFESNNRYDYLWRVLELTVPGFDPTIPICLPIWSDVEDIIHFSQAFLLFFRLLAKVKFHYDDRTRSGMFLRAVQYTEFADTVTTLLSHVNTFQQEFDDGYLPSHLRLHGLATSIHQTTQARLRKVISQRVRHVLEDGHNLGGCEFESELSRVQVVPWVNRTSQEDYTCKAARQGPDNHPRGRGGDDYRGRGSYDEPPR
jgi:hypothetical protein